MSNAKTGIQLVLEACHDAPRTQAQILRTTGLAPDTLQRILQRFLGERLHATRHRGRLYYTPLQATTTARLRSEPDLRCTHCSTVLDYRILDGNVEALRPCPNCGQWNVHTARTDGYLNRAGHPATGPQRRVTVVRPTRPARSIQHVQ
jgi:hypothetical protein